jgi:uncharacterized protein (TIGR03083 family)
MEIAEHIAMLRREGDLLADAAERAGLEAVVSPCPPWQVRDLLRHTGYIHRWAARHVTERPARVIDGSPEAEILCGGAPDSELLAWFRAGHASLAETLATADPTVDYATFIAASSALAFWARRQAHETAIHRADAESAAGTAPEYPAEFAADGVDELIMGFGRRRKYQPATGTDGGLLRVLATDTGDAWSIEAHEGRLQPRRDASDDAAGAAGCAVSGPASGVYLYLWNRLDADRAGVTITGDDGLQAAWQASVRIRWS